MSETVYFRSNIGEYQQGEILHWGSKVVQMPKGDYVPMTVVFVKDISNGEIVAFEPESLKFAIDGQIMSEGNDDTESDLDG